jgi:hypothetical protein
MCSNDNSKPSENIHYNYTVNLRLAPVEYGLKRCNASADPYQFIHLNAFNNYFKYLLPKYDGFSLPDVWDGYYHITLGKFFLNYDCQLQSRETSLVKYIRNNSSPEQHYATAFPCRFRTAELNVYSGVYRHAEAEGIEFVTLKVQSLDDNLQKLYPFLEIISKGVQQVGGRWQFKPNNDYFNELHVTVRKYQEDNSNWSSDFIRKCGIMERVEKNPLEFECIALDIAQTRRQARKRYPRSWWLGVTGSPLRCTRCRQYFSQDSPGYCKRCLRYGDDHECSGCGRVSRTKWPGYCAQCEGYERLKPLWSTES